MPLLWTRNEPCGKEYPWTSYQVGVSLPVHGARGGEFGRGDAHADPRRRAQGLEEGDGGHVREDLEARAVEHAQGRREEGRQLLQGVSVTVMHKRSFIRFLSVATVYLDLVLCLLSVWSFLVEIETVSGRDKSSVTNVFTRERAGAFVPARCRTRTIFLPRWDVSGWCSDVTTSQCRTGCRTCLHDFLHHSRRCRRQSCW